MSARATASATVSFGLVSIPVKLYSSGESSSGVRFNMLHRKCGSRLKQQYYCPQDNEVVSRDEMAKGYEFARGQYVLFSPEELKALEAKSSREIGITEFLPVDKVDPIYFEKTYYLGPDKGGDRAYKLLTRAMTKSGRAAVAKYSAHGKQYLVLLRPVKGVLVMQQLRYADEIRPLSEVPLGDAEIKDAELELALQIMEQAAAESFRPGEYGDEVRRRIEEAIRRKIDEGEEIAEEPSEEPKAQVIDLMEALKASLAQTGRKPARRKAAAKAKRTVRSSGKRTKTSKA